MNAQFRKLSVAVASGLMAVAALANAADTGLSPPDREFVGKAAQGGLMEVAAGKLAADRAQNPAVRAFGQRMVTDHTAANEMLKSLAAARQMNLPDSVSPDQQTALGKLESLNGIEFDQVYSDMMVKDHVTDIKEFETEAKSGKDADVKAFAAQTLPTLRHHLMLANRLSAQEKKSPSPPPAS